MDYGTGNLSSVEKALQYIGCDVCVTGSSEIVKNAEAVVLPGVGAFNEAALGLARNGLDKAVIAAISEGKPFLGICLGMQLLLEYSDEGGASCRGLGLVRGKVRRFDKSLGLKVPHMGWNSIRTDMNNPLFKGLASEPYVYFVHSYHAVVEEREAVAADSFYGIWFDAAIAKGNIFATQFHPEKSGDTGIAILKNFVDLAGRYKPV